jgi:hypothetical protein
MAEAASIINGFAGSTNFAGPSCRYCGAWHTGTCPRIEEIDYYPDGSIKRVKLRDPYSFAEPVRVAEEDSE